MTNEARVRLVIEASTTDGSVALLRGTTVLDTRRVTLGQGTVDFLFPAVMALCESAAVPPATLAGIVCGEGPGSFTSLRIAAALAKGIASGAQRPLAAVSSLLLAAASSFESLRPGRYLVHADALRQERFVQWVEVEPHGVSPVGPVQRMSPHQLIATSPVAVRLAVLSTPEEIPGAAVVRPDAAACRWVRPDALVNVPVASWEPAYGRLAEAQVQWEARHGAPLPAVPPASS